MKNKICDSVCKRKYNFVLKGAGISTEISNKKYKILLDRVDVITAYQVYNECNQKQNKERCVIDLAPIDFVNIFKKNCKFTPTIVLEDISFSPFYIGKITCACITKDEQLCLIVDCNGFKSKSRFNDEMPVGELKNVRIQIDPISVSSNTNTTSGTFIFSIVSDKWNGKLPIINTNKSFGTKPLVPTSVSGQEILTVTYDFKYVTISGNDGLSFSDIDYLDSTSLTIIQFDGIPLSRGGSQFFNKNLGQYGAGFNGKITATDVPKISSGTSLCSCFTLAGNTSIGGIENWNMSNVVNMSAMFFLAEKFDQDIGNWDTSNVTDMSEMFQECYIFNGDISNWNTSNVTNMSSMFEFAKKFNSDIGKWNVSNVKNMDNMFCNAFVFNQDLSRWCVEKINTQPSCFSDNTLPGYPKWGKRC
jgi:surface protein